MKPKQIKSLIVKAVHEQINGDEDIQPIFIEGPPGVGKSMVVREVAMELKIGWLDTRASQHDPTDFRGIPAVIDNKALWLPPQDIPYVGNTSLPEQGIWFLDEVTSAPPSVQAVLYQACLDHKIAEHVLKDGWYILAAGNRIEDRAVVYPMSTALANRFTHIVFDVDLDDWVDWALGAGINPAIIGFLRWRTNLLFAFNPQSSEKAFCSPRTWEFASRLLRFAPRNTLAESLEGTVGKGATAEFMSFLKIQNELPDLDKILAGDFSFVPAKIDIRYALVSALAGRATSAKHFENLIQYSYKLPAEFSVLLVKMLASRDEKKTTESPSLENWAREHSDIVVRRK